MRILYFTTNDEDYLQDSVLYGLRMRLGADLVDYPKKQIMYKSKGNADIYGKGFTLWGNLDDIKIDRDNVFEEWNKGEFDYTIFSSIYRQQFTFTHYRNFGVIKNVKTKWAFMDGEDDGFPTVVDAIHFGKYFKRENPFNYPQVNIIGLSIPAKKMIDTPPVKSKTFTTHVQCREAYMIQEVMDNCTDKPLFGTEQEYYEDLSKSKYGITMKKSGWDVPRHIENAGHYVVNCIYNRAWDGTTWSDKPQVHPLGLEDMKNCIIWDSPEELINKIHEVDKKYEEVSEASRRWADTKTCEYTADQILKTI